MRGANFKHGLAFDLNLGPGASVMKRPLVQDETGRVGKALRAVVAVVGLQQDVVDVLLEVRTPRGIRGSLRQSFSFPLRSFYRAGLFLHRPRVTTIHVALQDVFTFEPLLAPEPLLLMNSHVLLQGDFENLKNI